MLPVIGLLGILLSVAATIVLNRSYRRKMAIPGDAPALRPTLILPLTGAVPDLDRLLADLEVQTCRPRRLIVAVWSEHDPAYHRASAVDPSAVSFPLSIVVAGPARQCGQKCFNQIAALRTLQSDDEFIVLMDADIRPPNWWLAGLVAPLAGGRFDIVNGYRWPVCDDGGIGGELVVAIDRGIALLPRPDNLAMLWGGSIALTRFAVARLDLESVLGESITDDLAIGRAARERGMRVLTRRAVLLPTPVNGSVARQFAFVRRQYQIVLHHRPFLAIGGGCVLAARIAAWGCALVTVGASELSATSLAVGAVAGVWAQGKKRRIGQVVGAVDTLKSRRAQLLLAALPPVADLFHLAGIVAAAASDRLHWSGVTYRIRGPRGVRVIARMETAPDERCAGVANEPIPHEHLGGSV